MKKRINISLEDYLLEMLDEMAKQRGIDRSAMISFMTFEEYNKEMYSERYGANSED